MLIQKRRLFDMKAPDKLYCGIQELDTGYVYALSFDNNGEQEYINKDALLEIIKEESKFWDDGEMIFRALIEKINSL